MRRLPLLLFAFAACKATPTKRAPVVVAEAAASAPASALAKVVVRDPPVVRPGQRVTLSGSDRAARETYSAAIARGRKATVAKSYAEAIAAFGDALEKRPQDARALAERGYAELLANELSDASSDLGAAAAGAVDDDDLRGQAFFNLGLVDEKQGDAGGARLAFARAARLRPSAAVNAKLAGRSRCTAEISKSIVDRYSPDAGTAAPAWVSNWREALAVIDGPTTLSEADAKLRACATSSGLAGEPPIPATCDDDGPWTVSRDHMMFHDRTDFIMPSGGRMLVVSGGMLGSLGCGPMRPGSADSASARAEGGLLVVTWQHDSEDYVPTDADGGDEFECKQSDTSETVGVYDLAGSGAVTIASPVTFPSVTFDGKTVVVSGEGCSERIDLSKP